MLKEKENASGLMCSFETSERTEEKYTVFLSGGIVLNVSLFP